MAYLLGIAIFSSLILAAVSLYKYGNIQRQHILVTLSVLSAWCFSFLIVFSIPLDVTSTTYRQCIQENDIIQKKLNISVEQNIKIEKQSCQKPWGMVPDYFFPNLWRIIYWLSQLLTWIIMPLMQSYLKAGDFTKKGKFKSALVDNAIYYGSYLFICGILLIYIAFKGVTLDWQKLKAIASSASNTWGLFLLILLLGHALVEVPRSLWNNAKPEYTLQYAYFKAAKLSSEKAEAEENVDDILESLQGAEKVIPNNHILRPCIETILTKVPIELLQKANRNYNRINGNGQTTIIPSEKSLIRIHKQVIKSLQTLQRTEALWTVQVEKVFHLEDIVKNFNSIDRKFKSDFTKPRSKFSRTIYNPVIEWYWNCMLKYPFMKILAIITGTLSLIVVWSELTFFNKKPILSIFAIIFYIAKNNYDFLTIEIFSMATLLYLCYCAYSTVFRIKFLNLYYLAPHQQTNEHSLIFSGMLLCRLTPPMCLNFLGLIHMDSHIIKERIMETYYTQIMGHMDVLSIISDGFNIYFPMFMLGFCLATWFSLGSRTLNFLGFQQFILNEDIATELVQEGKDLIAREKRRRQRAEETLNRKREFLHDTSGNSNNITKYRQIRTNNILSPSDGLLKDTELIDYSTNRDQIELTNNLTKEINQRFGISTHVQIGFRGIDDDNYDEDDEEIYNERVGPPPRGIFDDV